MKIQPIQSPTFRYSNQLKTLYRKKKLPIKYGFYGDILTQKNVSLEHLKPHSKGGKTELGNLVLASKANNQKRGNDDIKNYLTEKNLFNYLRQFIGIRVEGFNGDEYIQMILKMIGGLIND